MTTTAMFFDPCKTCYLREFCSDECARLGFSVDVPRSPRIDREAIAFVNRISMLPSKF